MLIKEILEKKENRAPVEFYAKFTSCENKLSRTGTYYGWLEAFDKSGKIEIIKYCTSAVKEIEDPEEKREASQREIASWLAPLNNFFHNNQPVKISGTTGNFVDRRIVLVEQADDIRAVPKSKIASMQTYFIGSSPTLEQDFNTIISHINNMADPLYREIFKQLFMDAPGMASAFKFSPAAKNVHDNVYGGLSRHTIEVLNNAVESSKRFTNVDMSLIVAGSILHDIGKTKEYEFLNTGIERTIAGRLQGHVSIGYAYVWQAAQIAINNLELQKMNREELTLQRDKLLHIILSHHGKYEWGASQEPLFTEAVIVHQADVSASRASIYYYNIEDARRYNKIQKSGFTRRVSPLGLELFTG